MVKYRLIAEKGINKGSIYDVKPEGISIGRASQNDVHIPDEELSRHHCKLYFLGDDLWISDLATLNGTIVNGKIAEEPVKLGHNDRLNIGESELLLIATDASPATAPVSKTEGGTAAPIALPQPNVSNIDLGFSGTEAEADAQASASTKKTLLIAGTAFLVICLIAVVIKLATSDPGKMTTPMTVIQAPAERSLELRYAKTEGNEQNIFRYDLQLDAQGYLSVRIDDLIQGRHVTKKTDEPIDKNLRNEIVRKFERASFQNMDPRYDGIPRANTWNTYKMSAVIDGQAKTVEVRNRLEPEAFKALREEIETFGRNELGLWAIEFSREKLIELARESQIVGQKRFDEREIRLDNLFNAIGNFKSAIAYLETIEPKPEFYDETVTALAEAEHELEGIYTEHNWQADHAINTRNWATAAKLLRELMDIIPDRADPRNRETERRLLDVESRIQKARK